MCPPPRPQRQQEPDVDSNIFRYVGTDEPHASRRKEILQKYPEILDLYGPDIRLLYWCLALVGLQLCLSAAVTSSSFGCGVNSFWFWFLAWSAGGTLTHSISLANHELSHNLAFETAIYNAVLSIFCNSAQAIPSAITFKRYHLEHHVFQGHDDHDTDIPSAAEAALCGKKNVFLKLIWVFLQPLWYALRPILTRPKDVSALEVCNTVFVVLFDAWFGATFGVEAVLFNAASTLLGMGLHPCAGHFIAEHYTFAKGQETYSYYGPLNSICFNVGYHNEHHDFPKVSGFKLPEVRRIAPEYYDERWKNPNDGIGLMHHKSWPGVIYQFITNPEMGPSMRIKRSSRKQRASKQE